MANLANLLESSASQFGQKPAVKFLDKEFTFAEIETRANQVARMLIDSGVLPGDRVALSCPNIPYFPMAYYGILKAGAVVVPLNVLLKDQEIAYHLSDSGAKAYLCYGGPGLALDKDGPAAFDQVETCEHLWMFAQPHTDRPKLETHFAKETAAINIDRSGDDTAVILYTSGTTGRPKGAELTHSNLLANALSAGQLFATDCNDKQLVVLPLFHSFGQTSQMNQGFMKGQTMVFHSKFDPAAAVKTIKEEKITVFFGVPTMYWAVLNHIDQEKIDGKDAFASLRVGISGGASMPVEILKAYQTRFNLPVLEGYGLSETSPIATFNRMDRETKAGSIGLPIWGTSIKVVDEAGDEVAAGEPGEICIKGHNVMKGYFNKPEETAQVLQNGWFRTGDIAIKDEDGYLRIVDRVKDMIIRGGFNVYPREIEETLMTHPAVSLSAVIGVPHETHGEEVKAYVIKKPDAKVTEHELIEWTASKMAKYKYPRLVEFVSSLPMTATGKILKRELRQ